jgi:hypothetical protein
MVEACWVKGMNDSGAIAGDMLDRDWADVETLRVVPTARKAPGFNWVSGLYGCLTFRHRISWWGHSISRELVSITVSICRETVPLNTPFGDASNL